MTNIVMTRIDERLIHGQGTLWIKTLGVNTVIVANDEASEDKIAQVLMKTAVPSEIALRFWSVDHAIEMLPKAHPDQKIFLVVKNCHDAYKIVKSGIGIGEINIGNIHHSEGKEKISRSISLNQKEKELIKDMLTKGVKFNTKLTPHGGDGAKEINIEEYI